MKFSDIILTANHNLLRSKTRTFLTILAIFIGSFTIILNTAINAGVNDFIDKQVESVGGNDYLEITAKEMGEQMESLLSGGKDIREYSTSDNASSEAAVYLSSDDIKTIENLDGVTSVQPYHIVSAEYITSPKTDKKFKVRVGYIPSDTINVDTIAGRSLNTGSDQNEIIVTEEYASVLGYDTPADIVGQEISLAVAETMRCYTAATRADCLTEITGTVVGVQAPGVMVNSGSLNINLAFHNALYDASTTGMIESMKSRAIAATANVEPGKIDEIKTKLDELGFYAMSVDDQVGMIRTFFDAILIVFTIFGGIALLAAAIGIINTLFMSVQERTREIGLSKALGMSNKKIFLSFSLEACLLGFWGSVIGIIISMVAGFFVNEIAHATFLEDFPTFSLVIFKPLNMLIITLVIMFIAFLAGAMPARQAARKNPIDALRYE